MQKDKYTRLLSNTALFGLSTFSSKVLSFLLTRLYTSVLAEASFGIVDLMTACANLLIPLVSLGISNAVIRFGLEKGVAKESVFTGGLAAIGMGFGVLLVFSPLLGGIAALENHVVLLYMYVLASCLRTLCCQFVRAQMRIRLYALDGILSTIYTLGFNILYLVVLRMGTAGYLLAIITADLLSTIGLFVFARLWRYIKIKSFNKKLFRDMLAYSLPLVPASMFWWVTNSSDRFFITLMLGAAANGLYAAAYKVPSIVSIFSTIFTEAWQLSAVTDGQGKGRETFFSQIFAALMGVAFIVGGGLIVGCRFVMRFLVASDYFEAWKFIPFLVIGTVYSCLVTFLNSVYMVEKRSNLSLVTMLVGAASNLILNALFIPLMGANGAGVATFLSYLIVFVVRAINTRNFIRIDFVPFKMILNTFLLILEALIMIGEVALWPLWCGIILVVLAWVNGRSLVGAVLQLVQRRRKS